VVNLTDIKPDNAEQTAVPVSQTLSKGWRLLQSGLNEPNCYGLQMGHCAAPYARTPTKTLIDTYFLLFYNTNFALNVSLSLSLLLPFLILESANAQLSLLKLICQVAITAYAALLYEIVYSINDLVDYESDVRRDVFKSSLLSRTGSRPKVSLYLIWVIATLIFSCIEFPSAGKSFCYYAGILLLLTAVHTYWAYAKPVTLFLERGARFLAPPIIIYILWPNKLTTVFLLCNLLVYPIVMDKDYLYYLRVKRNWKSGLRGWTVILYPIYYSCCVLWISIEVEVLKRSELHNHSYLLAGFFGAPVLLGIYWLYNRIIRRTSRYLPARLVPSGNPITRDDRKWLFCRMVSTNVLITCLAVYLYAK
jgi:hypothetical protein